MPAVANMQDNERLVADYLAWFRNVRGKAPTSTATYGWTLQAFVAHLGGTHLSGASPEQVEGFMVRPRPPRGKVGAPATRRRDLAVLSSFYTWLGAVDPSVRNPTILAGVPKVSNRQPKALDDDIWQRVWKVALPMERVWLGLGFYGGLRAGELSLVRVHHVDATAGALVGFQRKGGNEGVVLWRRMASLYATKLPHLLPDLEAFEGPLLRAAEARDAGEHLVDWGYRARYGRRVPEGLARRFGLSDDDIPPNVPGLRLRTVLRRAGLHERLFGPHALRHSSVSNCLRMGLPLPLVQKLHAHSSPNVTMGYSRATERMLDEWSG